MSNTNAHAQEPPLWQPGSEAAEAVITRFQDFVATTQGIRISGYDDLWRWSVTELEDFWAAVWDFFEMADVSGYDAVLASDAMPGAEWFPGARLNFATYLLNQGAPSDTAVITVDELGATTTWTRSELRRQVGAFAGTLQDVGVVEGDRVVGYLPNIGEAIVAFLATASLGALWSTVGQDYADSAVVDRLAQLEPKVLVTANGYHFNGKAHDRREAVMAVQAGLPTLLHTVMVRRIATTPDQTSGEWQDWSAATAIERDLPQLRWSFDHPLWVLFSSGTTGLPKGLVHGHGGVLVETLKQMALHWNVGSTDRVFWYSSPSWVMWNLQLSTLALGASVVCYDGSPTHPDASRLWQLVADHEVTFFGTSPGFLQATEKAGLRPAADFDLSALKAMGSTGSPLPPKTHEWARETVGNLPLWSMSGGTDIAGAFVGGAPTVATWPGELSVRCLGVAIEAWDEEGSPVVDSVGELVITKPMPSMPLGLWNDQGHERYVDSYFSKYPGVWRQGDWIRVTPRGAVVIHGRSDSTLNRNGVRMGSADIYAAVETIPEIIEALVIGAEQPNGGYWMPLFVVLRDGAELDQELVDRVRNRIRDLASPRHVPDELIEVPGIPHTRTGKKLEVPVKRLLQGAALNDVIKPGAVDDPELLEIFQELGRSRGLG